MLFLELACIRWFPAHVLFLTFFTNTVLLACFLGISLGCLAADRKRNYLQLTPLLLGIGMAAAHGVVYLRHRMEVVFAVGDQRQSPQTIYFGTEYARPDLASFVVPIEIVAGFFFVIITLAFVGLGQSLGRALAQLPNRVEAYTLNILGSIAGIVLFALFSWWQMPPLLWFLPAGVGLLFFLRPGQSERKARLAWLGQLVVLGGVLVLASMSSGVHTRQRTSAIQYVQESLHNLITWRDSDNQPGTNVCFWSPYYRLDYEPPPIRGIDVNLIGHQRMFSREANLPAYSLPYMLNRDTGGKPLRDVLIIGAGSGNDVSWALEWGAEHIDAVEIDPVIQALGARDHPDRPYQDPRVHVHLDDGRNFLRSTDKQYDLILFALVDSLVLHSSYSNIRLESFLFTQQSFADVERRLKPDGMFVMYNYFRQGWIVQRLLLGLQGVFQVKPLVFTLPYEAQVQPEQRMNGFAMVIAGDAVVGRLGAAFEKHPYYGFPAGQKLSPSAPPGRFAAAPPADELQWRRYGTATIIPPADPIAVATDDWPFLYQRRPMLPDLTVRGILMMAIAAVVLLVLFVPRGATGGFDLQMFFLGAGFMLIETKAVVQMALLFGSTWIVNSIVFFAVLVMVLLANWWVLLRRPQGLRLYYGCLIVALAVQSVIPLDFFLGLNRATQVLASCLLVFLPILFAGVVFAVCFGRTSAPDRALGANIVGAMIGGLAENCSMLLGFQYLVLLALGFYLLSLCFGRPPAQLTTSARD